METAKRLDEAERKINGLAGSLDTVKEEIGDLKSKVGEAKGIAISADRGFHILSERVDSVKNNQEQIHHKIDNMDKSISGLYKQNFKYLMWLMVYILTLIGAFLELYKRFGN